MLKKLIVLLFLVALVVPAAHFAAAQDQTLVFTMWINTDHPATVNVFQPLADHGRECRICVHAIRRL
jgi:hypothetical protein